MNRTQIKQLNKKIDKILSLKKLSTPEEIEISPESIKKYGITYTKTLGGLTDEDLVRMIEGEGRLLGISEEELAIYKSTNYKNLASILKE